MSVYVIEGLGRNKAYLLGKNQGEVSLGSRSAKRARSIEKVGRKVILHIDIYQKWRVFVPGICALSPRLLSALIRPLHLPTCIRLDANELKIPSLVTFGSAIRSNG